MCFMFMFGDLFHIKNYLLPLNGCVCVCVCVKITYCFKIFVELLLAAG